MQAADYVQYIAEQIHTVVLAAADERGRPAAAQPAAWTEDENSLYFLTAKRKTLYECESFPFGGGLCLQSCPQRCIDVSRTPAVISQKHCLHCRNCLTVCPAQAVIERRNT